uniref:CSON004437 protein n=1 Tax=Culicoides sonorensis TaxID=179676 RepID=A0A336MV05_CULSO
MVMMMSKFGNNWCYSTSCVLLICCILPFLMVSGRIVKRSYADQSIRGYISERTCWENEICKEEFKNTFRCKCPEFAVCRSPGRYYSAYCSITETGYIFVQPNFGSWGSK